MSLLKWLSNISPFRGLPVDDTGSSSSVTSQSGETVQMYYNSSGTLTADAGQAAGTVIMAKTTYNNILNNLGDSSAKKGDTSLSFTSTALTTEVGIGTVDPQFVESLDEASWSVRMAAIGAKLANGEYYVDYPKGVIYGKKATTQATLTATAYKYHASAGAGSVSVTSIVPGTAATNLGKAEDAAHASSDTGVMALGVRQDTAAQLAGTDGDYCPPIFNSTGHQHMAEGFAPQAEDNTVGVYYVHDRPSSAATGAISQDISAALEASTVTKASAGRFYGLVGRIDSTHASGTYYLQVLNASSLPADGAVTILCVIKKQHTNGTDTELDLDFDDYGIYASTGIVVCLSTTEFTKTISGAFLSTVVRYQ